MTARLGPLLDLARGDRQADRVVPPSGHTAWLSTLSAAAMAFLAVFALAMSLAAGRLADRWSAELAQAVTIRVTAPADEADARVAAVLAILGETPGVEGARALDPAEQMALLEPWLGGDLPLDMLNPPRLVEFARAPDELDLPGLRLRLQAEIPGVALDDHARWRAPLVDAADRLRDVGWLSVLLIALVLAAIVMLAASAALAANGQVIRVLRLVGARDAYVARAFTRRFTMRAGFGALIGTALGMIALALLPDAAEDGFLTGIGFRGAGWLVPLLVPPFAAAIAFVATRRAAFRALARFE